MTESLGFTGSLYQEDLSGQTSTGIVCCSFFTPGDGYERYADRLIQSCRRVGLAFSVWLAPEVHCSISWRGSPDLRFTKASFIHFCLNRLGGAGVVYLDVDTVVVKLPHKLIEARATNQDFAVYNWLNDPHNEAYLPANHRLDTADPLSKLYVFSHRVEWSSSEQLNCSGLTQFYNESAAARNLLERWQCTIMNNPRSADDQSLNYAYNNPGADSPAVRALWLDKAYGRYPWWPHVAPVILHPAIPALSQPFLPVREVDGQQMIYLSRCSRNEVPELFPRDGGVDTDSKLLFRVGVEGRPYPVGQYTGEFWIYGENPALSEIV